MIEFELNGEKVSVDVPADTPLLWVVREELRLTGTKFGCGMGLCGACTMHIDGTASRTCIMPISAVAGRKITTIEGLSTKGPSQLQKVWAELGVPQCGYCQSGQIMSALTLLESNTNPSDEDIDAEITNICRCGTLARVRKGIKLAVEKS